MPRCGRSIGGGSERRKSRFHDPRTLACRGLMHPFVGGIASASPRFSVFPASRPSLLRRTSFSSLSAAASHPRSHKRFYDLHPVRVRGRYSSAAEYSTTRERPKMNSAARHHLRGNSVSYFRKFFFHESDCRQAF